MKVPSRELKEYIDCRLKSGQERLSLRLLVLLSDVVAMLDEYNDVDLFNLLVETVLRADEEPSRAMAEMLALVNLEELHFLDNCSVSDIAAYIRDAMKHDAIRCHLAQYLSENTEQGVETV